MIVKRLLMICCIVIFLFLSLSFPHSTYAEANTTYKNMNYVLYGSHLFLILIGPQNRLTHRKSKQEFIRLLDDVKTPV